MTKKNFTPEEIEILRNNPNVSRVTPKYIVYTTEFKQKFWKEYCERGHPTEIMKKYGFPLSILGSRRIGILQYNIKQEIAHGATCYSPSVPPMPVITAADAHNAKVIKQLQTENKMLKEELEFIKKIIAAETSEI